MTYKQRLGAWLIPKLPINRHVFDHFRLEINAWIVRTLFPLNPIYFSQLKYLQKQDDIIVNLGCGPFGLEGWINLDLFSHDNLSLRVDVRHRLPLADNSCRGIHCEHFFEHLNPSDEVPRFLQECLRCLKPQGVLRIIVPDAGLYIKAYQSTGWDMLNQIGCGGDIPEQVFKTKMQAINHVFLQGYEHYAGYDQETLELVLRHNGFSTVKTHSWRKGEFPGGCIDREQHVNYSLYVEARK
jgi:predicted SAM-dependent methyltransferase